jgi:flagellar biosynthesis/type III secretory pathway M-ring protein FliF/YscJ
MIISQFFKKGALILRNSISFRKDSLLDEKKAEAKARVIIALRKGAELSKSGIAGIKGVVAAAVWSRFLMQ